MRASRRRSTGLIKARKTVGYARVSTDDQAREGVSLQAQEARIRAVAEATGRPLDEIVVDAGLSGKTTSRPGLKRILYGVRADQIAAVIVLKLDRLTRSIRDLADLMELFSKRDVAFASVQESLDTSSAAGRMITNLLGVLAEFEREQIGERTAFALAYKRKQRQVYGHVPYGWKRQEDRLIPIPEEQGALVHVRRLVKTGLSYRKIGAWLNDNGFRPRQGGREWHPASVGRCCCRECSTRREALKGAEMFTEEDLVVIGRYCARRRLACDSTWLKVGAAFREPRLQVPLEG